MSLDPNKTLQKWLDLSTFLNKWYYQPDLDALKIALSVYVSHSYIQDNPIWLFVLGSPGSGKTSIVLNSILSLPGTYSISEITTNSLLSGFGENMGILPKLTKENNGNGMLCFPDFSTFLEKRAEDRGAIVGQLRRVYDGAFEKDCGNKNKTLKWKGKVSIIAACTPAIEEYWALNRGLGERFMYVRWPSRDSQTMARTSIIQIGNEELISKGQTKRIKAFVDQENLYPIKPSIDYDGTGLIDLAAFLADMRVCVKRDTFSSKRPIISVDAPESPTRIMKSLALLARGHATLMRREEIEEEDLKLARRLASDSIPPKRLAVLNYLLTQGKPYECRIDKLVKHLNIPRSTMRFLLDDMEAIGVLSQYYLGEEPDLVKVAALTERTIDRMFKSKLIPAQQSSENFA